MATQFDMTWDSIKDNNGSNVAYMKLETGSKGNRVRIVSNPSEIDVHWEKDVNGGNHRIVCAGSKCLFCERGEKPQTRYQMLVLDKNNWNPEKGYGSDGAQVKVLEVGRSVITAIKQFALDPDYGNPTTYDLKIKKEGSGRDTRYSVSPSPKKSELTDEEKEAVENAPSLKEINKVNTNEELLAMNLASLQDMADDDEDEAPKKNSKGSEDDDEDGWDNF